MEKLLHLFNTLWFERGVLSETNESTQSESNGSGSEVDPKLKKISHARSSSDQQLVLDSSTSHLLSDAESPNSVLRLMPKLETVVSGKEIGVGFGEEKMVKKMNKVGRGRRRSKRRSKSLTEMEFEEVKGFMDLEFEFSEEDHKDSSLVLMIPGLQRHSEGGDGVCVKCGRRCGRKEKIPLMVGGVMDDLEMKNQIKFWAHSVASAVR